MARLVNLSVNGAFIRKDNKNAGVQGEANVTVLHIVLDATWAGFAKRIVWRDAKGENPVAIILYTPPEGLLEPDAGLVFDTPIPAEPLAEAGWCSFTIEGYREAEPNQVLRTARDVLEVKPNFSPFAPAEPTPDQAQQLQAEIEGLLPGVTEMVREALDKLGETDAALRDWSVFDYNREYHPLNGAAENGKGYLCLKTCRGISPSADVGTGVRGEYWILIADRGPVGPAGPIGPAGPQGPEGPQGPLGATGPAGLRGPEGQTGAPGGMGPVGPPGPQGDAGGRGPEGQIGTQGVPGPRGEQGPVGVTGPIGPRGEQGERGINGVAVAAEGSYAFCVDGDGNLVLDYLGDEPPAFSIDETGALVLDL